MVALLTGVLVFALAPAVAAGSGPSGVQTEAPAEFTAATGSGIAVVKQRIGEDGLNRELSVSRPSQPTVETAAATSAASNSRDRHATVNFFGNATAELYSKEVAESLNGVLQYNYVSKASTYPVGFVRASPDPQPWHKTFWTRDGGTFLRELVKWGYLEQARHVATRMIQLVGKNPEGYYAFPRYFESLAPRSGEELDGTSAIIIGMAMLVRHLPSTDPVRAEIYRFLHDASSPVKFLHFDLKNRPLLLGTGEFGGGMGIKGAYYNVVQNELSALALTAAAEMEADAGDEQAAQESRADAEKLTAGIERYLVGKDDAWLWCVDPKTLEPETRILSAKTNQGFGGINGVLSMYADVGGLEPAQTAKKLHAVSMATFDKLYHTPERERQFNRYGIWTQFDLLGGGMLTSPSYGQGYAIQDMLLSDRLTMASKALDFLAGSTFRPVEGYALQRTSPLYFYERMYSPEAPGKVELAVGCGALNLVNVSEPLKTARMIVGIDDSDRQTLKLVPRLPRGWSGFDANDWPVATRDGATRIDVSYRQDAGAVRWRFKSAKKIGAVVLRLPDGDRWKYFREYNCDEFWVTQPN